MIDIKGYKFRYSYQDNGLIVKTPNGNVFKMNCEGLAEAAIIASVQHFKFYKELYVRQLLKSGASLCEAVGEANKLEEIINKMKNDLLKQD